jgi:hypothetical protein
MNIDNTSLTSLNQEFKEYENINIDFDVLDFWRKNEKKFPLLSQVAKRCDFSASGYTVWDIKNALLRREK